MPGGTEESPPIDRWRSFTHHPGFKTLGYNDETL